MDFMEGIWLMLNQQEPKEYLASGETHSIREFGEKTFNIANITGQWEAKDKRKILHNYKDKKLF